MTGGQVNLYADEVRSLIEERLRVKAQTLDKALSKAGRLLPKWAQREGRYLTHAQQLMGHPKLHMMIDEAKVDKAHKVLVQHLKSIDPSERRKTQLLTMLGSISFGLIVVAGAFVAYLVWRGYV